MRLPRLFNSIQSLRAAAVFGIVGCSGMLGGCILDIPSFIDPGETSGLRIQAKEPLVVQILDELDPALEQGNRQFASAQAPQAEDMVAEVSDYVIGSNDLLQITIFNLEGPGLQTIKTTRVSGTGNITLPYLQQVVRASGLNELEIQQAITQAYKDAAVVEDANVSVSVMEQRNRAYTITGSVQREGEYVIASEDFRVLNALSQAGGVSNSLIEEIYIFRPADKAASDAPTTPGTDPAAAPGAAPGQPTPQADDLAPPAGPQSRNNARHWPKQLKKTVMLQEQGAPATPAQVEAAAQAEVIPPDDSAARVGRIDGQDVVVQPGADVAATAPADAAAMPAPTTEPFAFDAPETGDTTRVIRIPLSKLRNGDLEYNIPIRPRDIIMVPPGLVGFYYMHGHVAQGGAFEFRGQKVTLKQAIAAARGLDGLAIPQRTDIIRKVGPNQEMFYRVDLAAIFAGKRPDIFLKPDDTVSVGTNFLAPFLAAIRGGFRMTYGFGFLYDRNFAYDENDQNR